jgi:hypothetical protein
VAWLVADMAERVPRHLETVLSRARDGAYLSASQFASDLRAVEAEAAWRRRELALALALLAAALVAMLLLLTLR